MGVLKLERVGNFTLPVTTFPSGVTILPEAGDELFFIDPSVTPDLRGDVDGNKSISVGEARDGEEDAGVDKMEGRTNGKLPPVGDFSRFSLIVLSR